MVILQRWEPVISDSFPTMIPFWIELQGLPKHYWKPEMIFSIGEDMGEILDHEITNSVIKMKVLIDGLKPLVMEILVEFPDGSEALVSMKYKSLKGHCKRCFRLSHEQKDCPGSSNSKSLPMLDGSPLSRASGSYTNLHQVSEREKIYTTKSHSQKSSHDYQIGARRMRDGDNPRKYSYSFDRD